VQTEVRTFELERNAWHP